MNIILVCSSLEPGRDGVGDYSRLLAGALINQGHACALLALNDKFVRSIQHEVQLADDTKVAALRIPTYKLKDNIRDVQSWIIDFNPDWLSLQYVIFGYHNKGLPFNLSKQLSAISQGRKWHIMFHELWLGIAVQESVKLKLWGRIQKYLIKTLIRHLNPRVINTQTPLYQILLQNLGYKATCLPLFSNIPKIESVRKVDNSDSIKLVVFGTIHTGALIKELAADAAAYTLKHKKTVLLTFIGACGSQQEKWVSEWQNAGLSVDIMGKQPAGIVSAVLQNSTIGILSTAVAVAEKSGSFAAMRAHRLPVLNISKPWQPTGVAIDVPLGVTVYEPGSFEKYIASCPVMINNNIGPTEVAKEMLAQLTVY
ncbi:hypothetical protein ACFQZS_11530 [Mucilaginibacter calamicampi]|uniref:Uncharacterized protein n=1 Tax=Mucilaginibacter calamicampi TaxID=1302352 RepID=A0ABW2YYV9_9SPHI